MEFKALLQDYTRAEFTGLVSAIWNAEANNDTQALLIDHFDKVVGHPLGADLIFYPPDAETGNLHSVGNVLFHITQWHHRNGVAPFAGESVPVAPIRTNVRLSAQERKVNASNRELDKAQQITADIEVSAQTANGALEHFSQLMDQWQSIPLQDRGIAQHVDAIDVLELALSRVVKSLRALETLRMKLQFAKTAAERNVISSFHDPAIQNRILELINQSELRYQTAVTNAVQRHAECYGRSVALFDEAERSIVGRLAEAGANTIELAQTVRFSLRSASKRPCLMVAAKTLQVDEGVSIALKNALRSAVAEFDWQAISLEGGHPGTCSAIATFSFAHWKARDWYALSVPLRELMPGEGHDWQHLARTGATVKLPYRLFSRTVPAGERKISVGLKNFTELQQICLTPADGTLLPSDVRVRLVDWDPASATFSLTLAGKAPVTLRWFTTADVSSAVAEAVTPSVTTRGGSLDLPKVPLLETVPLMESIQFEDCVVVFPLESEIEPIYLTFKGIQ
ncbi:S-type pyocin domain-containing protein [Pseudomonas sp. Marseille-P9899]|uniref:S-type pyocin domain-containing protein n=1 Tax=Pseudomonas sp. Marseille-P9899 TaxID=2730401 RepID=UPI00158EA5C0|nr:S-type pyocin domain-containing protein [Pseudomonas sp. Marseille-P9899]